MHPRRALGGTHTTTRSSRYLGKGEALGFDEELVGLASDGGRPGAIAVRVARVPPTPPSVVTTIRGDARSAIGVEGLGLVYPGPREREGSAGRQPSEGRGIVKTVRIDQCRVSPSDAGEP